MNRTQVLLAILTLSRSQGSYGRLYNKITDGSPESEEMIADLVAQNFKSITELVLYIEN